MCVEYLPIAYFAFAFAYAHAHVMDRAYTPAHVLASLRLPSRPLCVGMGIGKRK